MNIKRLLLIMLLLKSSWSFSQDKPVPPSKPDSVMISVQQLQNANTLFLEREQYLNLLNYSESIKKGQESVILLQDSIIHSKDRRIKYLIEQQKAITDFNSRMEKRYRKTIRRQNFLTYGAISIAGLLGILSIVK